MSGCADGMPLVKCALLRDFYARNRRSGVEMCREVWMKTNEQLFLMEPDASHEKAYMQAMDRWEATDRVQPGLLARDGADYEQILKWCADYKVKPEMFSTNVTCTLFFLVNEKGEVLGGMVVNHEDTHRGHLHAGIVPWRRGEGLGTEMLRLALDKCREMGMEYVHIVPFKDNSGAVGTILNNGGTLVDEFFEDGKWSQRYRIAL